MRGGVRSRVFRDDPTVRDGERRGMGRGGGDVGGEGGRDSVGLGMVRWRGDCGKTGNSRAPSVKGGIGFPSPQYESSALDPCMAAQTWRLWSKICCITRALTSLSSTSRTLFAKRLTQRLYSSAFFWCNLMNERRSVLASR
jgi:hypothetical protein